MCYILTYIESKSDHKEYIYIISNLKKTKIFSFLFSAFAELPQLTDHIRSNYSYWERSAVACALDRRKSSGTSAGGDESLSKAGSTSIKD